MTLISPHEGEKALLEYILGITEPDNPVMRLYTSPTSTLTAPLTFSSFVEPTDVSYAAVTLLAVSWSVPLATSGTTTASYPEKVFTFAGASQVYGYYVTDQSANKVLWAEKFGDQPFNIPDGGGTISITPRITLT
jgi:hypothetical protein